MATYTVVTGDGNELCNGVSEREIQSVAQAHADRLGETVYYSQSGGGDLDSEDDEDIGTAVEPQKTVKAKEIKINVFRDGSVWFAARWIDGEYDGCDSLEISDDASDAEAIEAAEALMPHVSGERLIARVDDIDSKTGQVP